MNDRFPTNLHKKLQLQKFSTANHYFCIILYAILSLALPGPWSQGAYRLKIISARSQGSGEMNICILFCHAPGLGAR